VTAKYIIKNFLLVMTMVISASCTHTELPRIGRIVDSDTKKPISEVVVNLNIGTGYFPWATGGESYSYEAISDTSGWYNTPISIRFMGFLEFLNNHELYFHKSGYYSARVLDPGLVNNIELFKVKYLSDHYSYVNHAKDGGGLYFIQKHNDKTHKLQEELAKIANTKAVIKGEPAFFSEIPGATLTNILCGKTAFSNPVYVLEKNHPTHESVGMTCAVFDTTSQKWFGLKPQGQFFDYSDKMPSENKLLVQQDFTYFSFANQTHIFGYDNFGNPSSDKSRYKPKESLRGNISSITGASNTVITIEDNGRSICRYFITSRTSSMNSCLQVPNVLNTENSDIDNRMIFLSKYYNEPANEFYGISKTHHYYILYKIKERDDTGKWIMSIDEYARIPIDDELIRYYSEAKSSYLHFAKSGLRKFVFVDTNSAVEHKKEVLKKIDFKKQIHEENLVFQEDIEFKNKISRLDFYNKIRDFAGGPSAGQDLLYIVTGESKIYRIMPDGSSDYIIEIK